MPAGQNAKSDTQRFSIKGRVVDASAPDLQDLLAQIRETPERPRCLCVPGGVEMYVARHRLFVVKRMPDTGSKHHPSCASYEPALQQSGLGELMGDAVLELAAGQVQLRVDFPWARSAGQGQPRGDPGESVDVATTGRRMSLRALMHFLLERAGFNRWSPAMDGKRNQGVFHKYMMAAAEDVLIKGVELKERLFVPEPFSEVTKSELAQRRREKLAVLLPQAGSRPLAMVVGEYKSNEPMPGGRRVWIKHMPDAPLLVDNKTWARMERVFAPMFEARDADHGLKVRLILAALIRARREQTYEIDAACMMLTNEQWIPLEGIHELHLMHALVTQRRRFIKPLRYDAKNHHPFPNALLLDVGETALPLHVVSAFASPAEREAKAKAAQLVNEAPWLWWSNEPMPQPCPDPCSPDP